MGKRSQTERTQAANHLDRIMNTLNAFPGVQLKRSKKDKHSYQVESKVKGAIPVRNVNFGCYGSLEEAQRAYNYGMYVMGASIQELPYFIGEDPKLLKQHCPEHVRERLYGYIKDKVEKQIVQLRRHYIKTYIDACKWKEDSPEFVANVLAYWQALDRQREGKHDDIMQDGDDDDAAVFPSSSQGVAGPAGQRRACPPRAQQTDLENQQQPSAAAPAERRRRFLAKRSVIKENTAKAPDYPNLPSHHYGIRVHAGGLGVHEYPPQVDAEGDYICPCFFNHNFNSRSKSVVSNWRPNDPLSVCLKSREAEEQHIRRSFRKYLKQDIRVQRSFTLVNDVREVYNYESRECVQDYYKGPLPLGFLDLLGNTFFMPSNESELHARASDIGGVQRQRHDLNARKQPARSDPNRTHHHDQGLQQPYMNAAQGQQGPHVSRINQVYGTEQNQGQYLQHAFLQGTQQNYYGLNAEQVYGTEQNQGQYLQQTFLPQQNYYGLNAEQYLQQASNLQQPQNYYDPNAGQYMQQAAPQQLYQMGVNMGTQPQYFQQQVVVDEYGNYQQQTPLQQPQNYYDPTAGQYMQQAAPQQLYQTGVNMGTQPQYSQPQVMDDSNMVLDPTAFQQF